MVSYTRVERTIFADFLTDKNTEYNNFSHLISVSIFITIKERTNQILYLTNF